VSEPDRPEPVMVIADHYQMARAHARELRLGVEGRDWRYLSDVAQLLGRRPGRYTVRTEGGRWLHGVALQQRVELYAELRRRGWTVHPD
jgi:hypothetical protein